MTNLSDKNINIDRSGSALQEGDQQKRPYAKPVLVKHGNLRDITLKVGRSGHMDGGIKPEDHTKH
jgi:hypothetical protein